MPDTPDNFDPQLPPELQRRLGELYRADVNVPEGVDDAILSAGRRRLHNVHRFRMLLRWGGAAAAAAAVLAVVLWHPFTQHASQRHAAGPIAAQSRQSNYTILDAYRVAANLQSGQKPDSRWDLNRDGVVDQKDVDQIAREAVSLQ